MPLFVKPKAKLTRAQVHDLMSHHFEGTCVRRTTGRALSDVPPLLNIAPPVPL